MNIPSTNRSLLVSIDGEFAGAALAQKMVHKKVQLVLMSTKTTTAVNRYYIDVDINASIVIIHPFKNKKISDHV